MEQHLQRILGVKRGVEIQLTQAFLEGLLRPATLDAGRAETTYLIRNRAAAMADDELELGKILKHFGAQDRNDGNAFLNDEVQRIIVAMRPTTRTMDHGRHVEFDQFFIDRIPIFVAHARRRIKIFTGVRIKQTANEAEFLDAAFQFRDRIFWAHAHVLRQ